MSVEICATATATPETLVDKLMSVLIYSSALDSLADVDKRCYGEDKH